MWARFRDGSRKQFHIWPSRQFQISTITEGDSSYSHRDRGSYIVAGHQHLGQENIFRKKWKKKTLNSDFPLWLFIELTFKVSMLPRHGALAYKLTSLLTILLKTIWFPIKLKYDAGLLAGAGPAQGGGLSLKLFICISAGARRRQSPAGTPLSSSGWYLAFHGTSPAQPSSAQPSPAQETHLNTTVCNWYHRVIGITGFIGYWPSNTCTCLAAWLLRLGLLTRIKI